MTTQFSSPSFPALLQDYFTERLMQQRRASPQTILSYRDAFRLLLQFAADRTRKPPSALTLLDFDPPLTLAFLNHLEKERGNCPRTRNARLAAFRSFLRYASFRDPASLSNIQRVLAIPLKRFDRPLIGFLSRQEMLAILAAPDRSTWLGRRDHAMLSTFYNTGARVSEIAALRVSDLSLAASASLRILGKGRKERPVPLWKNTAAILRRWLPELERADGPLFPSRTGSPLSRSTIEDRLELAVKRAAKALPSLRDRRVSPHILRHTTAMHLLQSGVDLTVIALWLGHESPATTHQYLEADLAMKERALKKLQDPPVRSVRYRASDAVLAFLDGLDYAECTEPRGPLRKSLRHRARIITDPA
jgi:site-specific recombinase XerD